jgi:hypothetical protein
MMIFGRCIAGEMASLLCLPEIFRMIMAFSRLSRAVQLAGPRLEKENPLRQAASIAR